MYGNIINCICINIIIVSFPFADSSYASVDVNDLIYLTDDSIEDTLTIYTPVNSVMSASWEPTGDNLIMPKW